MISRNIVSVRVNFSFLHGMISWEQMFIISTLCLRIQCSKSKQVLSLKIFIFNRLKEKTIVAKNQPQKMHLKPKIRATLQANLKPLLVTMKKKWKLKKRNLDVPTAEFYATWHTQPRKAIFAALVTNIGIGTWLTFRPLRFYVKINLCHIQTKKLQLDNFERALNFDFW